MNKNNYFNSKSKLFQKRREIDILEERNDAAFLKQVENRQRGNRKLKKINGYRCYEYFKKSGSVIIQDGTPFQEPRKPTLISA